MKIRKFKRKNQKMKYNEANYIKKQYMVNGKAVIPVELKEIDDLFKIIVSEGVYVYSYYSVAICNACSISSIISLIFSIPTEKRIKSGLTPASLSCSSVS